MKAGRRNIPKETHADDGHPKQQLTFQVSCTPVFFGGLGVELAGLISASGLSEFWVWGGFGHFRGCKSDNI